MTIIDLARQRLRDQIAGANRRAALVALALFLLLLAGLATADDWYEAQLLNEQRVQTGVDVKARAAGLATMMNSQLSRLHGLAGYVIAAEDDAAIGAGFDAYAAGLHEISEGLVYMALAPDGVVTQVHMPVGNQPLLGKDLLADQQPEVRAAANRAVTSEEPVLAGPFLLDGGGLALVGTRVIFRDGSYWGLAQVMLDVSSLLREAGISADAGSLELAVRDAQSRVFMGDYAIFAQEPALAEMAIADERWTVAGIPRGGWAAAIGGEMGLVRIGGFVLAALLALVVYLTLDRQERLERAVARRTQELAEERAFLEQRVEERTRELQTLLDVSRDVASTLDFPSLLGTLLDQMQQVVEFSGLAVYLFQNGDRLELAQHSGPDDERAEPSRWLLQGWAPSPRLRALRAPLTIADVSGSPADVETWQEIIGELAHDGPVAPASWMAVPLLLQERVLGVLVFYHATAGTYTPRRAQLAMAMANHVAVAVENARLYEQARSLAALQERQKLARELHDSVSQALYGIGLGTHTVLELLERNGAEVRSAELRPALEYTLSLAKAALVEMRALIFELRPESLEVEGLVPALARLGDVLHARHQIEVQTDLGAEPDLPAAAKEALYRIAQEGLNNVAKHARASRVTIRLAGGENETTLEIGDDGSGFDPQGQFPGHLGLQSMRERVEGLGGSLTVTSASGSGTTIRARLPERLRL